MAKRKLCTKIEVYVRTIKNRRIYKDINKYGKMHGWNHGQNYLMRFTILDLVTGETEVTEEMIITYCKITRKFINETLHVQVSRSTIEKENYTKLSGNGNEPRLALGYTRKRNK